jgi:hypothetical protein
MTNRIVLLGYMLSPELEALIHIFTSYDTAFKVSLKRNRSGERDFVWIG